MPAVGCPEFEYDQNPRADAILKSAMIVFFQMLRSTSDDQKLEDAKDTRTQHRAFFSNLTPQRHPYYAGHYRGEDFFCLKEYEVKIHADPLVGEGAIIVPQRMMRFEQTLQQAAALLDIEMHRHERPRTSPEFLVKVIHIVAYFFSVFLTIHPYANGNGHMARVIVVLLLDRFGIRAPRFTIHPRPLDPPYSDAIYRYRRADPKPLELLLLGSIA